MSRAFHPGGPHPDCRDARVCPGPQCVGTPQRRSKCLASPHGVESPGRPPALTGLVFPQAKLRGPRQPVSWDQVGQPNVSRLCAAGRMCKDVGGSQQPAGARPAGQMGRPRCSGASHLPRSRGRRRGSPTSGSLTPESAPLSAAFKVKCASLFSKLQAEFRFC